MTNKKSIMAFSAFLILIFHLWIYVIFGNKAEMFIKQTAYFGVDIFFFLSAFSLAKRDAGNYIKFISSRFKAVYLKYIIFAVIAFIYAKWKIGYLFETVFFVDLIKKGGGAFLWFLPAIMMFYAVFPLFQMLDKKKSWLAALISVLIWAGIAAAATKFKYASQLFIVWNRIPVFLLGYYMSKYDVIDKITVVKKGEEVKNVWWIKLMLGILLTVVGYIIMYKFAYMARLNVPFTDMFYLTVIPASIGLILLVSFIPEITPIKWIGSSTLEMYAIQMIFGYKFENMLIKHIDSMLVINILTIVFVIVCAVAFHYAYAWIEKLIKNAVNRDKKEEQSI